MFRSSALALLVAVFMPMSAQAASWANEMFPSRTHDFGTVMRGKSRRTIS